MCNPKPQRCLLRAKAINNLKSVLFNYVTEWECVRVHVSDARTITFEWLLKGGLDDKSLNGY